MEVNANIACINGIGDKYKKILNSLNIYSLEDMLLYFPRRYEKLNIVTKKNYIQADCINIIRVKVLYIKKNFKKNNKIISTIIFTDGKVKIIGRWFNMPYVVYNFKENSIVIIKGKINEFNGEIYILNGEKIDNLKKIRKVTPKYNLKKGITNNVFMKFMGNVLNKVNIKENMPENIMKKYNLCSLDLAINNIHFPLNEELLKKSQDRLKFQELFTYSLKVLMLREFILKNKKGFKFQICKEQINKLLKKIPYKLTNAQSRVIQEILRDQNSNKVMNRLLQGDVGSGKTIVAIIAMFNIIENGYQAVLMAPTEILAMQHYKEISCLLDEFGIKVGILVGSLSQKEKNKVKEKLKKGEINLILGTHALIEEDVEFNKLGLIVTDEQHRFGVSQRNKLNQKGENCDILVMSATPIPRTLALFLYGDLDISIIDELPKGRKNIDTFYINKYKRNDAYKFAIQQIKKGRQVYVVCPLVEENEELNIKSVEEIYKEIKVKYFANINIAILHGKMKSADKRKIMEDFKKGEIKVLISTTVIEVGVNVPNANLMIVENAERFGLAQLHQLRGRVGRGTYKSYCILIADINNNITLNRMKVMKESNDGFFIAEQDLKIRGSGEIFGIKQHGDGEFLISNVQEDVVIFKNCYNEAKNILNSDEKEDIEFKKTIIKKMEQNNKYICFN